MMRLFWRKRKAPTPEMPTPNAPAHEPERDMRQPNTMIFEGWPAPSEAKPWSNQTILDHLLTLSPTEFEHAVARLLPKLGYTGAKRTGGAGDLGVDIVCYDRHGGLVTVQCKRYALGKKVTSPDIQTFFGMMVKHAARQGIYVTTSTFTRGAFDLAADRDIRTIDGAGLAALFARHLGALGLGSHPVQSGGRTSYERPCHYCGRRIEMRLMPNGRWMPFDHAEFRHDCRYKRI
jgi:HJR/Mrr/RecB family endonuclease